MYCCALDCSIPPFPSGYSLGYIFPSSFGNPSTLLFCSLHLASFPSVAFLVHLPFSDILLQNEICHHHLARRTFCHRCCCKLRLPHISFLIYCFIGRVLILLGFSYKDSACYTSCMNDIAQGGYCSDASNLDCLCQQGVFASFGESLSICQRTRCDVRLFVPFR